MKANSRRDKVDTVVRKARIADFNPNVPSSQAYPGQRPLIDPWVNTLIRDGIEFWKERGVTIPQNVSVDLASDLEINSAQPEGIAGRGWYPETLQGNSNPRIALREDYYNSLIKVARSRSFNTKDRRTALKKLASIIYHELGHVGGVPHSEDSNSLMASRGDMGVTVPFSSEVIVRGLIPRPKRRVTRKRTYKGIG